MWPLRLLIQVKNLLYVFLTSWTTRISMEWLWVLIWTLLAALLGAYLASYLTSKVRLRNIVFDVPNFVRSRETAGLWAPYSVQCVACAQCPVYRAQHKHVYTSSASAPIICIKISLSRFTLRAACLLSWACSLALLPARLPDTARAPWLSTFSCTKQAHKHILNHCFQEARSRGAAQTVALQARMRYQQAGVSPCTVVENFTCGASLSHRTELLDLTSFQVLYV